MENYKQFSFVELLQNEDWKYLCWEWRKALLAWPDSYKFGFTETVIEDVIEQVVSLQIASCCLRFSFDREKPNEVTNDGVNWFAITTVLLSEYAKKRN